MEQFIYFTKSSLYHLFQHRKFVWINIFGLATGLTVSLLILLYIRYETSYDHFNPEAAHIYRVLRKNNQDGQVKAATPLALSDVLKSDFPAIDQVVGLMTTDEPVKIGKEAFGSSKGAIVEPSFFRLFNFPLVQGDQEKLFEDPYEVVITRQCALRFFGTPDAMGKTLSYEDHLFTVVGIVDPMPSNSLFDFDYFLSSKFRYISYPDINSRWYEMGLYTFITFKGHRVPAHFEDELQHIEQQYYPDFMKNRHQYMLTGFKGSHLKASIQNDLVAGIPPVYLWILAGVSCSILLIACLNFINISIAGSGKRYVEIGIKKVSGATSGMLLRDFFMETTLIIFISLCMAFFLAWTLLPTFNVLIAKQVTVNWYDPLMWAGVIAFSLFTILITGFYPALLLSKPSPRQVMSKSSVSMPKDKISIRQVLVVVQFTFTIILVIALVFIQKQVSYMKGYNVGFDMKNLVTIPVSNIGNNSEERMAQTTRFIALLDQYQSQYGYSEITTTEFVPGFGFRNMFKLYDVGRESESAIEVLSCDVDQHFCDVFGMDMRKGRFFSKAYRTDENAVILNEAAWRKLGWDELEGKEIGLFTKDNRKKVVGVINDVHVTSLQHSITPMIYQFGAHHNYPGYVTLRLNPDKTAETMSFITAQWQQLFPDVPFEYERVTDKYNAAYVSEERLAEITGSFSLLALLLSLLGIFALSAIQSEQRIKEIGIRKVNGARVREVILMLNKDFVKWVVLAFVLAVPVAYYALYQWLQSFAYQTRLNWWIFPLAGVAVLLVALLTVSWQSWKAATQNPVEALRYE